jgi:hypothetical protein
MGIAAAALAKAKQLREQRSGKNTTPKPAAKAAKAESKKKPTKKTKAAENGVRKARKTDIPYAKIARMYDEGKSVSEISDHFEFTNEKSNWPYSYTYGILKSLRKGVEVDGKVIKVQPKRGE